VAQDGSTPVPNSLVSVQIPPRTCGYCDYSNAWTDQSGYFGFETLQDGQYQVIAHPPYGDSSKADSAPQTVTVAGGLGSGSTILSLQNPNVTGVVRGPNGVSVGNWKPIKLRIALSYEIFVTSMEQLGYQLVSVQDFLPEDFDLKFHKTNTTFTVWKKI
jgi:hypothetical protein